MKAFVHDSRVMDSELKTFVELQNKHKDIFRQINTAKSNFHTKEYVKKMSALTYSQVAQVPEDTRVYKSVGKMFMLSTVPELKDQLQQEQLNSEKEMKKWSEVQNLLTDKIRDVESQLKDMSVRFTKK